MCSVPVRYSQIVLHFLGEQTTCWYSLKVMLATGPLDGASGRFSEPSELHEYSHVLRM